MMPSVTAIDPHAGAPVPSVDSTLVTRLIPGLLSVIAGSTDVISFLRLAGLFTAHADEELIAALQGVSSWSRQDDLLVLEGEKTLRFRIATN
jgi:hypothetical protein